MNTLRRSLWPSLVLSLVLLLGSCAEQKQAQFIRIKKGPPPEIIAEDGKEKLIPAGYIKRRFLMGIPSLENLVIHDRQYIYITEKWFYDVIVWTEDFIRLQVPNLDFNKKYPLAYDETFALLASEIADISVAKKYNIRGSVLIGLLVAKNEKPWGKIAADGEYRVYVFGLTEEDFVIYDIRTRQLIQSKNFPNSDFITGIMF